MYCKRLLIIQRTRKVWKTGKGNSVSRTGKMWTNISGEKKYSTINAGKLLAVTVEMKKKCRNVMAFSQRARGNSLFPSCLVENTAGKHSTISIRYGIPLPPSDCWLVFLLHSSCLCFYLLLVFHSLSISIVPMCLSNNRQMPVCLVVYMLMLKYFWNLINSCLLSMFQLSILYWRTD